MEDARATQTAEYVTARMNGSEAPFSDFANIAFEPIQDLDEFDAFDATEPTWRVQFRGMSPERWFDLTRKALPGGILVDDNAEAYGDECTIQVRREAPDVGGIRVFFLPYMVRVNGGEWISLPRVPRDYADLKVRIVEEVQAVPVAEDPYTDGGGAVGPVGPVGPAARAHGRTTSAWLF